MKPFIKNLKDNRMTLITEARAMLDKAGTEKRALDGTEQTTYENLDKQIENLTNQINLAEKQEGRDAQIAAASENRGPGVGHESTAVVNGPWLRCEAKRNTITNAFERKYSASPSGVRGTGDYIKAFANFLMHGNYGNASREILAALQADSDTAGGYTVAPQQFVADLIQAIDDQLFVRQLATVTPVMSADSVGRPSLDADPSAPTWTSELLTGSADTTMSFGKRELHPHPLAKSIKVSRKLLRISALSVESVVIQRMAYVFAVAQENGFLNGTGANQPLGLFTATNDGIGTARDVSSGNSTTAIGADGLINALYGLKPGYMARASWIFHRDAVKAIRKLKDGNGQYLWQPGLSAGQPDRILDRPFYMSEYAPSTFTTGLYVGIVGDFSYYWIADALNMEMQRLNELYAATNQVGFIGRSETDGMPILAEAFSRVTLA